MFMRSLQYYKAMIQVPGLMLKVQVIRNGELMQFEFRVRNILRRK